MTVRSSFFPEETISQAQRVAGWSSIRMFGFAAVPLFVLYLASATWSGTYHIDSFTNVLAAWEIAQDGSPYLDDHEHLADPLYTGNVGWVEDGADGAISQYPPGAALHAVPLYAVWPENPGTVTFTPRFRPAPPVTFLVPPLAPAAITSALVVAVAMGLLAMTANRLVPSRIALGAAYVVGLGTAAWSVAADQLWQHGPAMLWIVAGAFAASRAAYLRSGVAYGLAVLVRVPTAIVAAAVGLMISWRDRSPWPALKLGAVAAAGLAAVIVYNAVFFGNPSITGGYGSSFVDNAADLDGARFLRELRGGLFDSRRGLFFWSPFLVPLLLGIRAAWRVAPAWAKGSAVGGLLYLLFQWKANRFSGGGGFSTYRYPIEAIAAAAPLLVISYWEWVRENWLALRVFALSVGYSVAGQAVFAFGY